MQIVNRGPIYVAGHGGLVGKAILRRLKDLDLGPIITASRAELDLTQQENVDAWFANYKPSQVYLAAAKVGGILANDNFPAEFIYENLMMQSNVIHSAHRHGVQRLLFLGSSCIYPRDATQPISESVLLSGPLEPTNEPYAIAKIAGIKLCESYNRQYGRDYRSVMPTNLYGPGDNFDHNSSHVIPALMRRFHEAVQLEAPTVTIWGTGSPRREFLHVDDMATACVHIMQIDEKTYRKNTLNMQSHLNIGTGSDCTIQELAQMLARITGFKGKLVWDTSKPNGTTRKLLDVSRLTSMGWHARITLEAGLESTYAWFVKERLWDAE